MPDDTTKDTTDAEAREESSQRKERVLHTRVPAVLEDELKRLATNLKMPVSNVVRAILEDAIEAVEVVGVRAEDELKGFVHRLSEQREAIRQGATAAGRSAALAQPAEAKPAEAKPAEAKPAEAKPAEAEPAPPSSDAKPAGDAPATEAVMTCPSEDRSLDDVIGFQQLTLRADSPCTVCGRVLPRGTEACRGVRDDGGPRVLLGPTCKLLPTAD